MEPAAGSTEDSSFFGLRKSQGLYSFSPDVPDPPENVRCMSVGEDTAVITWDPPSFDGGVPVKGRGYLLSPL